MKTITIAIIAVLVASLVATQAMTPSVYAVVTPRATYESGLRMGQEDAHKQDTSQWYILQYQQGFQFHSKLFIQGYITGFCSVLPHTSSDDYRASWDCDKGPDSASWVEQQ